MEGLRTTTNILRQDVRSPGLGLNQISPEKEAEVIRTQGLGSDVQLLRFIVFVPGNLVMVGKTVMLSRRS